MARTVEDLESEIRSLSAGDRMHLLRDLIADLDGEMDAGVESAWLDEAQRRYMELKEGTVALRVCLGGASAGARR